MRLLRLALFNIRKHKIESASLFLLMMICMTFIATSMSGLTATINIFDEAFERTECISGLVYMTMDEYKPIYPAYFENDPRVKRFAEIDASQSYDGEFINESGKKRTFNSIFVTEEGDAKMEKLILDTPLTREEIYAKEHFILLPFYAQNTLGYEVGDTFEVFSGNKVFPFEIAGFYESGYYSGNSEMKMIVSPADLARMQKVFGATKFIVYEMNDPNQAEQFLSDFYAFADENAVGNETIELSYKHNNYEDEKIFRLNTMDVFTKLITGMSIVIFISIVFIIMFRIKNDVDEQMVSIGVLEALGYKSDEISVSYVMEYLIVTVPAVICGLLVSLLTTPVMVHIGERLVCHRSYSGVRIDVQPVKIGVLLIVLVAAISFWRALRIRKFPPVVAFRKGTADHFHKRSFFNIEKTKFSVHLRLAAKSFLAKLGSNIGMGLCISISVIAFMVCFVLNDVSQQGIYALLPAVGREIADISILTTSGTDVSEMAEEIKEMDGVRNVLLVNNQFDSEVIVESKRTDSMFYAMVYDDYSVLQNVHFAEGRAPKHDNECVMQNRDMAEIGKNVGDTITVNMGRLSYDYIIVGSVDVAISIQYTVYFTPEGFRHLCPSYAPEQIDIFLENRDDKDVMKSRLTEIYGAPAMDFKGDDTAGSLEERIRAKADEKMSVMLEMYGIDHMDYAIQIDDTMIKGDSSRFKIQAFVSLVGLLETAVDPLIYALTTGTMIFMLLSLLIITLVILLLISSSIRSQRHEFGIMKGMGYSSKELMIQTAIKVIPVLAVSVIIGSAAGMGAAELIYSKYGDIPAVTGKVTVIAVCIVAFGFAVAWFSARKIKDISVYELMQE